MPMCVMRHGFKGHAPSKRGAFNARGERHDAGAIRGWSLRAMATPDVGDAWSGGIVSEVPTGSEPPRGSIRQRVSVRG